MLGVPRNAVLPQFLTWKIQVGAMTPILSFRVARLEPKGLAQARSTATRVL